MKRTTNPPVDIDVTRERLVKLGLVHASEQLATWLGEAVAEEAPPHRFLDRLLEEELRAREPFSMWWVNENQPCDEFLKDISE